MKDRTLVVDVDGVLCDLVAAAIPKIECEYNCSFCRDAIVMFEMDRVVGVGRDDFNKRVFGHLDYTSMQPVANAADGLRELGDHFRIVIATSRPEALAETTRQWLSKNGFPFDEFACVAGSSNGESKKRDIVPPGGILVDDDLREVIGAWAPDRLMCLLNAPWNQSLNAERRFVRCADWSEIVATCLSELRLDRCVEVQ